jgi:triosephosphate isomerase
MRRNIVAGNWKMNGTIASANELLNKIKQGTAEFSNVEIVVLPPFPFLEQTAKLLKGTKITWGAQNLSDKPSGAYTGEVSASMLKEFGCKYVLVGHSERRQYYGESDKLIAAKFNMAIDNGLIPILCIGETLQERQQGLTLQVIDEQLLAIIESLDNFAKMEKAVIAYEPVWAIGTGMTATPEQAEEVHAYIRKSLGKRDQTVAENLSLLYGGSVKPDNAKAIFSMADIDGGLIGGASLNADDFLTIGRLCNS